MTNNHEINYFIENHNIKKELKNNFEHLLKNNYATELDIIDKNISLDTENIEYKKTEISYHLFKCSILRDQNGTGYYALIYDDNGNLIDELFLINR